VSVLSLTVRRRHTSCRSGCWQCCDSSSCSTSWQRLSSSGTPHVRTCKHRSDSLHMQPAVSLPPVADVPVGACHAAACHMTLCPKAASCCAASGLGDPEYVWISFFTDWTFCVLGASGLLGFLITLWRMAQRAKHQKRVGTRPDAEAGHRVSRPADINGTDTGIDGQRAAPTAPAAAVMPPAANGSVAAAHESGASGGVAGGSSTAGLARKVTAWMWQEH
jgi:hypothetical protein